MSAEAWPQTSKNWYNATLDANTIDWDRTEKQEDIVPNGSFSFSPQNIRYHK